MFIILPYFAYELLSMRLRSKIVSSCQRGSVELDNSRLIRESRPYSRFKDSNLSAYMLSLTISSLSLR